jgi:predicted RNase H-like nuclease (RuvC/YqgF family)
VSWWQTLLLGTGGAGGGGVLWRFLKSRRLREIAVDVLDGPDDRDNVRVDAIVELRVILDEQRRGYEHLSGRVETLEQTIAGLQSRLAEEQTRAKSLQRQLRDERKVAGARIGELERLLAEARSRIDHLEALLAAYYASPDGQAPGVEVDKP